MVEGAEPRPGHDDELAVLATQSVGLSHVSYQHDGHQYALALDAAAQVAAFRPDLLEAPPETWDEVLALAEQGRVVWPAKPIDAFSSLVTIAATHGEERWLFAAGAIVASITWFFALGFGARHLGRWLRTPRAWRILDTGIAVLLVIMGVLLVLPVFAG